VLDELLRLCQRTAVLNEPGEGGREGRCAWKMY
jgi:hypothetical protein